MLFSSPLLTYFRKGGSFIIALLMIISSGCRPQPSSPVPTETKQVNPSAMPTEGVLEVTTRVDCGCDGENIVPFLYIEPSNGTPPYLLPGYDFVTYQLIPANLGDVLQVTIWSSDQDPLTWTGEIQIPLACEVVPPCAVSSSSSSSTIASSSSSSSGSATGSSSSRSSRNQSSSSSASSSSSSSASSSSSSSQSSSSSSSSSSNSSSSSSSSQSSSSSSSSTSSSVTPIPTCPPKPQGGTQPPGLCKKN